MLQLLFNLSAISALFLSQPNFSEPVLLYLYAKRSKLYYPLCILLFLLSIQLVHCFYIYQLSSLQLHSRTVVGEYQDLKIMLRDYYNDGLACSAIILISVLISKLVIVTGERSFFQNNLYAMNKQALSANKAFLDQQQQPDNKKKNKAE